MKALKIYFGVSILLFSNQVIAQNLVPNPGFELYSSCPSCFSQLSKAAPWYQPSQATPDFYHVCAPPGPVNIPNGLFGSCYAHGGEGMTGIYVADHLNWQSYIYKEYLGIKLSSTLVANQKYYVTFYVKLANYTSFAIKSIGLYFSQDSIFKATSFDTINAVPQITNSLTVLTNKTSWTKISGTFTAVGNEKYIYVGNFNPDSTNDTTFIGKPSDPIDNSIYYYIDDICISPSNKYCEMLVGVDEAHLGKRITIYPNPNSGLVRITTTDQEAIQSVIAKNIHGDEL